jgi:hypothetical protein
MKLFNKKPKKIIKGQLTQTPFNIIQQSDILTEDDINKLTPLTQELKETFVKSQVFRTRTEMEVSVLNDIKFPTSTLKYWQATREQNVMFQELVMLSYEYRKNTIKIKQLEIRIKNEDDDLEKELLQIEMERKMFISKNQEKTAKDRIRELKAWSEIKEREAENMNKEDLMDVDNGQLIGYTIRWIKPERQNLHGQLRSGILACIEERILDKVLEKFSDEIKTKIKREYGIE